MQHSNTDSCILLKFYIKPQLFCRHFPSYDSCILLKFYIKPQPRRPVVRGLHRCILLKFYIKPQLAMCASSLYAVVSY